MTKIEPRDCESMDDIRSQIDRLDRALIELIAERFGYIQRAWQIKLRDNGAALVPWRVEDVVAKVRAQAASRGLPEGMIEDVWRRMMSWFIQYEDEQLRKKLEQKT